MSWRENKLLLCFSAQLIGEGSDNSYWRTEHAYPVVCSMKKEKGNVGGGRARRWTCAVKYHFLNHDCVYSIEHKMQVCRAPECPPPSEMWRRLSGSTHLSQLTRAVKLQQSIRHWWNPWELSPAPDFSPAPSETGTADRNHRLTYALQHHPSLSYKAKSFTAIPDLPRNCLQCVI